MTALPAHAAAGKTGARWVSVYRGCGCRAEAKRRKDLPIACEKHGTSSYETFKS